MRRVVSSCLQKLLASATTNPKPGRFVARDPDKWMTPGALSSEDLGSSCSRQPEDSHSFKWYVYLNSLSLNGMGFIAVKIGGANIP